jgi:hypothetical protein
MAQKTRPALYTIRQIMFDLVGIDNYTISDDGKSMTIDGKPVSEVEFLRLEEGIEYTDVKYNDKAGVYYQINLLDEGDTVKLIIRSYDAVWAEAIGELI